VRFKGEGSIDAGGPYREAITEMCIELQSKTLSLFIPCPNFRNDIGVNREKWIINPAAVQASHLSMYEFVGKLFGIALRSGNHLNLDLPSLIWQELVGVKCSKKDLEYIDLSTCQTIDKIISSNRDSFDDTYRYSCLLSNGTEVELVPGGKHMTVLYESKLDYANMILQARFNESKKQIEALKRGLGILYIYIYIYAFLSMLYMYIYIYLFI
jgi:E3 ubiquitin-protein ligase HERC2